ncbi:MAG: phosphatase PAP2 family protein [Thermoanaerobaculia bacterium]|nr:phosphatase PAP2 family protein [Thermoanaerobaculia bacterium]
MRVAIDSRPSWQHRQHRMSEWELPICRLFHERASAPVRRFFCLISRIGDGHYGYIGLVLLFLVLGTSAIPVAIQAASVALAGHLVYKALKRKTARPRPLHAAVGFDFTVPPLDRYSFPSGHTLHAVAFAFVASAQAPVLGWILVPFAVLVGLSRVVLGLHYPTDVLAGALLGSVMAWGSFQF